jgi:hypothetical protein
LYDRFDNPHPLSSPKEFGNLFAQPGQRRVLDFHQAAIGIQRIDAIPMQWDLHREWIARMQVL